MLKTLTCCVLIAINIHFISAAVLMDNLSRITFLAFSKTEWYWLSLQGTKRRKTLVKQKIPIIITSTTFSSGKITSQSKISQMFIVNTNNGNRGKQLKSVSKLKWNLASSSTPFLHISILQCQGLLSRWNQPKDIDHQVWDTIKDLVGNVNLKTICIHYINVIVCRIHRKITVNKLMQYSL